MDVKQTDIVGVLLITPKQHRDARGVFSETYSREALAKHGVVDEFVQDNQSLSVETGTVRGLHFQSPPFAQGKLVRVAVGAILDVAVDIRVGSPTYGRHVAAVLNAENGSQLWVPEGFAHGFCTLTPNTQVIYKVTRGYAPQADSGVRWDDPALGIAWPVASAKAILSEKDARLPTLSDQRSPFVWAG